MIEKGKSCGGIFLMDSYYRF